MTSDCDVHLGSAKQLNSPEIALTLSAVSPAVTITTPPQPDIHMSLITNAPAQKYPVPFPRADVGPSRSQPSLKSYFTAFSINHPELAGLARCLFAAAAAATPPGRTLEERERVPLRKNPSATREECKQEVDPPIRKTVPERWSCENQERWHGFNMSSCPQTSSTPTVARIQGPSPSPMTHSEK